MDSPATAASEAFTAPRDRGVSSSTRSRVAAPLPWPPVVQLRMRGDAPHTQPYCKNEDLRGGPEGFQGQGEHSDAPTTHRGVSQEQKTDNSALTGVILRQKAWPGSRLHTNNEYMRQQSLQQRGPLYTTDSTAGPRHISLHLAPLTVIPISIQANPSTSLSAGQGEHRGHQTRGLTQASTGGTVQRKPSAQTANVSLIAPRVVRTTTNNIDGATRKRGLKYRHDQWRSNRPPFHSH